jgi:hypothetical protein
VELGRVDLAVRQGALAVLDQRARAPPAHAQAAAPAAGARPALLAELLVAVDDGRVAEGQRDHLGLGLRVRVGGCVLLIRLVLHLVVVLGVPCAVSLWWCGGTPSLWRLLFWCWFARFSPCLGLGDHQFLLWWRRIVRT